jgi:hypothetical protein
MYFNYTFLLTNYYENDFIPDSPGSYPVILPVAKPLWQQRARYFQKLYAASNTFCFGFLQVSSDWANAEPSYIRDSLSSYFFLPNYGKVAGAYLIISDLEVGTDREMMDTVEQLLNTQGITPLSKNYIVKNSYNNRFNNYYYYSDDLVDTFNNDTGSVDFSVLFEKLVAENGTIKQIILPVKNEDDFKRKAVVIEDFERWIANNEKEYADLLSAFKATSEEYLKLKITNDKLRFGLQNYSDYLKALRKIAGWYVNEYQRLSKEQQSSGQQSTSMPGNLSAGAVHQELNYLRTSREEILQWYTKEYEVLPLWYKRFGHVIKMAMGKKKINEYLRRPKKNKT